MLEEDARPLILAEVARVLPSQRAEGRQMSVYAVRTACRFGRLGCLWTSLVLSVFAYQVKTGLWIEVGVRPDNQLDPCLHSAIHVTYKALLRTCHV